MKLLLVYRPTVSARVSPHLVVDNLGQEITGANDFLSAHRIRPLSRCSRPTQQALANINTSAQHAAQHLEELHSGCLATVCVVIVTLPDGHDPHSLQPDREPRQFPPLWGGEAGH